LMMGGRDYRRWKNGVQATKLWRRDGSPDACKYQACESAAASFNH
jgi:hypothetical protein